MPLASDPHSAATFWLSADRRKDPDRRPTFFVRVLTRREAKAYAAQVDGLRSDRVENLEAWEQAFYALIGQAVAGWKNLRRPDDGAEIPYRGRIEDLEAALTTQEFWELLEAPWHLEPEAMGFCVSPASSPQATSAPLEAAAGA